MSAKLDVNIAHASIEGRRILAEVAFSVAAGEIVAVLGASGCGKTTLLRAIAGLHREYTGRITIGTGASIEANLSSAANEATSTQVGVVYQEPRLMPWLTVEENIRFGLEKEQNTSIDELLHEVSLENARQYWPKQLSGGMAQRVAIARALAREPEVLLMDEPFSALDVLTRRRLHVLTRAVTARHQTASVIVTHDPIEAVELADRILVLAQTDADDTTPANSNITPSGARVVQTFVPAQHRASKHTLVDAIIDALSSTPPTCSTLLPIPSSQPAHEHACHAH
jgi:sulfonate transport system ATP-binding protein